MGRRIRAAGFTILEFLIAFTIVLIAAILVVGLFTAVLNANAKGSDRAAGVVVAQRVLNEQLSLIYNGGGAITKTALVSTSGTLSGTISLNSTTYSWTLTHEPITDQTTSAPLGGSSGNLAARVEVVVTWQGGSREGQGLLQVALSQVVHEEEL